MKKTKIALRLTALLLALAMLMTFAPVSASAEPVVIDDAGYAPETVILEDEADAGAAVAEDAGEAAEEETADVAATTTAQEEVKENWFTRTWKWFWANFSFLHYAFDPTQMLVYNKDNAFQHLFGFNQVYDVFTFAANVYADTIRVMFDYEGKEWMVQLWKGAYAGGLAAGGEIGIYNKPLDRKIKHYDSARSAEDLFGVGMSIYHKEKFLFKREFGKRWWTTGFQVNPVAGLQSRSKPRNNLIMDATIQLKSAEMARLFAEKLEKDWGFHRGALNGISNSETFTVNGDTVRLVWKFVNESFY